jgi:hypothetical protein
MKFGVQIRSAANKKVYDTDAVTWNQAGVFSSGPGTSQLLPLPSIIGREVMHQEIFTSIPSISVGAIASTVNIDTVNGTVHVVGGQLPSYVMVFMR